MQVPLPQQRSHARADGFGRKLFGHLLRQLQGPWAAGCCAGCAQLAGGVGDVGVGPLGLVGGLDEGVLAWGHRGAGPLHWVAGVL